MKRTFSALTKAHTLTVSGALVLRVERVPAVTKNPAPAGEEEGWMNPEARESEIYFSMASLSGTERE